MEKLLLLTFTERSGKAMRIETVNEDVAILSMQMKRILKTASSDLLQPREEAVNRLLKLARQ
jgi:hypothetical protein